MATDAPNSDVQRFTRLWMKNQDALAGYIYLSIRDFHHAEDVLQEVAQSAAGSFERYDADRPFIGWLIGIARQRIADHYRRQGRRLPTLSGEAMEDLANMQIEMAEEIDVRMGALRQCLSTLSERHRHAIELRYGRSLSPQQIAEHAGVKRTAVNALIYRIRKALADCIANRMREEC